MPSHSRAVACSRIWIMSSIAHHAFDQEVAGTPAVASEPDRTHSDAGAMPEAKGRTHAAWAGKQLRQIALLAFAMAISHWRRQEGNPPGGHVYVASYTSV